MVADTQIELGSDCGVVPAESGELLTARPFRTRESAVTSALKAYGRIDSSNSFIVHRGSVNAEVDMRRMFTDLEVFDIVDRAEIVISQSDDADEHYELLTELRSLVKQLATYSVLRELIIPRMKREIVADLQSGRLPQTVRSFQDLHDHVDANEYGGFCEEQSLAGKVLDVGDDSDAEFVNACQDDIHQWIADGSALREAFPQKG